MKNAIRIYLLPLILISAHGCTHQWRDSPAHPAFTVATPQAAAAALQRFETRPEHDLDLSGPGGKELARDSDGCGKYTCICEGGKQCGSLIFSGKCEPSTFDCKGPPAICGCEKRFALQGAIIGPRTSTTSIAGSWDGRLVTEAINVKLELEIEGSGSNHIGTWEAIANSEILNSGELTGTVNGEVVTLIFDNGSPATFTGKLKNGTRITGVYQPASPGGQGAIELEKRN